LQFKRTANYLNNVSRVLKIYVVEVIQISRRESGWINRKRKKKNCNEKNYLAIIGAIKNFMVPEGSFCPGGLLVIVECFSVDYVSGFS